MSVFQQPTKRYARYLLRRSREYVAAYDYYTFYRCYTHGWACYGYRCPRCEELGR